MKACSPAGETFDQAHNFVGILKLRMHRRSSQALPPRGPNQPTPPRGRVLRDPILVIRSRIFPVIGLDSFAH